MKRLIFLLVPCIVLVSLFAPFTVQAAYTPDFEINSEAAYLVNMETGKVIYEKNAQTQYLPASTTKIMTAIIALETIDDIDNTMVTAPAYVFDQLYGLSASNADLRVDEQLSMKDLLYALMLRSACEGASIIADYIGQGDIQKFIDMMNAKAEEIGCTNTHFVNAHGLDEPDQLTTAYDMYLITNYALTNEQIGARFREIATTYSYTMAATNKHPEPRVISHTNKMMSSNTDLNGGYSRNYVQGIKTGTSNEYFNLVTMAKQDGYTYLLVTLGAHGQNSFVTYADHAALYDWAFKTFESKVLARPGSKTIPNDVKVEFAKGTDSLVLTTQDAVSELLPKDVKEEAVMWDTSSLPETVQAPIRKGDKIGEVQLKLQNEVVQTVTVVAAEDVGRSQIAYTLYLVKTVITSWWFLLILAILIAFIIAYIVLVVLYNKRRKKKKYTRRYK